MMAVFSQKCDNGDNLVTTFLGEVVTGLSVAVSGFARKCDNVTTSLRDTHMHTHMHTHARAHVRAQMDVTDVTHIKNNQITKTYPVTTCCFWGCHRLSRLSQRFFFQSGGHEVLKKIISIIKNGLTRHVAMSAMKKAIDILDGSLNECQRRQMSPEETVATMEKVIAELRAELNQRGHH